MNLIDFFGLAPFFNGSSRPVAVTGNVVNPDGSKGDFRQVTVDPGGRIDENNPHPFSDGTVLNDVDAVDFNGDGIAEVPENLLDTYPFGEKILGGSTGLECTVVDAPGGGQSVVPVPSGIVSSEP